MKPNINSVEVHQELCNNTNLLDGALVGASSLWPSIQALNPMQRYQLEKKKNVHQFQTHHLVSKTKNTCYQHFFQS